MKVKAPSDVVEYIREKFQLVDRKVVKNDGSIPSFTIINKRNYSMSYVKDVLEGKDPDLSVLFDTIEGELYRNQDPVWAMYKGKKVSDKGVKVCGVMVTQEGIKEILERAVREEGYEGFLTLEPHLVVFDALKSLELADADSIIRENKATNGAEGYAMQYHALKEILNAIER